jgi:hypothetical protein
LASKAKLLPSSALLAIAALSISGCIGGDDARVVGRVTSVSATQVCVAPVGWASGDQECRGVPDGATVLPAVGQCVSLVASGASAGQIRLWEANSLAEHVPNTTCDETRSP